MPRRVIRHRNDDDGYFEDLPMLGGDVGQIAYPFDLNAEEQEAYMEELAAALKRKRPCGFAPWPEDTR